MPVIRIEVPENTARDVKKRIREGVKQAVLDTLAPKEIKYDYVAVVEAFGELGDGLPLATVDLRPGRDAGRKKALADAIAVILQIELNSDPLDLYVLFRENPARNHYTGGTPLADWVPSDE
jgi:phenylpyruvate tautomerase PptA (4-oxalocrotonate tautomerase family)